mgnify:CR=1 FL=1
MTSEKVAQVREEAVKALMCLYLAVNEDVARDVDNKITAYVEVLAGEIRRLQKIEEAAKRTFDCQYRDESVTDRGRPTTEEIRSAYQNLGEVLGNFGGPCSALAAPKKENPSC